MYTDFMSLRMHICSLFVAAMFVSCSPAQNEQSNKNASTEYEIPVEQEIDLKDCLSQSESQYLVFFHSETCSHCREIREDILFFANENILKVYFLDIKKPSNEVTICQKEEIELGISSYQDIKILGTPTIIKVENGVTTANVAGKEECLTLINQQRLNYNKQIIA